MDIQVTVKKVINNNVLIAEETKLGEIVIIGKGIGIDKVEEERITDLDTDEVFILQDEEEQKQYRVLMGVVSEKLVGLMNDVVNYIQERVDKPLNEHIHPSLTDHFAFAIKRIRSGLTISNPFLTETEVLYPKEYEIARGVIELINERLNIEFPEGEVGFVALHIYSAITNRDIAELNEHSRLINEVVGIIEENFEIEFDKNSIYFQRLIRHLFFLFERTKKGEVLHEPDSLKELLKQEYNESFKMAEEVIRLVEEKLETSITDGEIVYLTMHLNRLIQNK